MKYNKGDKVTIRSLDWYNTNKNERGYVGTFVPSMAEYCGKVAVIVEAFSSGYYLIDLDDQHWCWEDYMFEEINTKVWLYTIIFYRESDEYPYNIHEGVETYVFQTKESAERWKADYEKPANIRYIQNQKNWFGDFYSTINEIEIILDY